VPVRRRGGLQVEGPKTSHTDRGYTAEFGGSIIEETAHLLQCDIRYICVNADLSAQIVRTGSDGADELGPARFDGPEQGTHEVPSDGG